MGTIKRTKKCIYSLEEFICDLCSAGEEFTNDGKGCTYEIGKYSKSYV
jgi:hypothetical protein